MKSVELSESDLTLAQRSGAVISPDGLYRYKLWRQWAIGDKLAFVMLNPSTADAEQDDPTIRKCMGFAKTLGFAGITIVNVFPFRATDPRQLRSQPKIPLVHDENAEYRSQVFKTHSHVVAAWGNHAAIVDDNATRETYLQMVWAEWHHGSKMLCLCQNKNGHPKHPLYVSYREQLKPFRMVTYET